MNREALKKKLFNKYGTPIRPLESLMESNKVSTLEEIERLVKEKDILPFDVFCRRGGGSKSNPGILAQYLFGLPSKAEKDKEKIFDNLGWGI